MNQRWRIELFGGLRAVQGSRTLTRFRTQKTASLFAYLARYLDRAHPRELLIEQLWPEANLDAGRNSLSTCLSSLRHQFEPPGVPAGAVIMADRQSVRLRPEAVTTDVSEFEGALNAARRCRSRTERVQHLGEAVDLYRGALLPGFYEEWVAPEQQRLADSFQVALRQLTEALERNGDLERALEYARRAVTADPLREESQQELIRLLASVGQPAAAHRQYRELERLLDQELGTEPSPATRQLVQEIEQQSAVTGQQVHAVTHTPIHPHPHTHPTRSLPTGTVTFLLTDIEASTSGWNRGEEIFRQAHESHHALLRRLFREHSGVEVKDTGDGFLVVFAAAGEALACAVAAQKELTAHPWPEAVGAVRVRMALHTAEVEPREGDYYGPELNHAFRLLVAGHGGQILCSQVTAELLRSGSLQAAEAGVWLAPLGVFRLRDAPQPERLYQVEFLEMPHKEFPSLKAEAGYTSNLPLQFTRFFGRERELAQLTELLLWDEVRLVTLTGPGGTGKSRLALEAASRLVESFDGAVWFVPLAALTDPSLIPGATLDALRVPRLPNREPLEQLLTVLARQPTLLLLDNYEQLLPEGADLVRTLLDRVSSLKCLTTSRQVLGLTGEREFPVPPLSTPNRPQQPERLSLYESVQLFVDRAQQVRPDFQVTANNAAAIAELCDRLEGIPLAIELAAARSQVLTPQQMLSQLAHRFDFLVSRKRDTTDRHRALRSTIEWSYRLLSEEIQWFFSSLSVFRGGWTLEAAEAVCEEPLALDHLAQLRDCSLVITAEQGPEMRFRMLESLREYGAEQLATNRPSQELTRKRHRDFFLHLAEKTDPWGPEPDSALRVLDVEHPNLRAALDGCLLDDQGEAGLKLAIALRPFWDVRDYYGEGRHYLTKLLSQTDAAARTKVRADALNAAGALAHRQGDYIEASSRYQASLEIRQELGDLRGVAGSLLNLSKVAKEQGNDVEAGVLVEKALACSLDLDDPLWEAVRLHHRGSVAAEASNFAEARSCFGRAV